MKNLCMHVGGADLLFIAHRRNFPSAMERKKRDPSRSTDDTPGDQQGATMRKKVACMSCQADSIL